MPRTSQSMLSSGSGGSFLQMGIAISNTNIFPVSMNADEATKFSEVRGILAETMTRIIRREQNTNAVLAGIAQGRNLLREIKDTMG